MLLKLAKQYYLKHHGYFAWQVYWFTLWVCVYERTRGISKLWISFETTAEQEAKKRKAEEAVSSSVKDRSEVSVDSSSAKRSRKGKAKKALAPAPVSAQADRTKRSNRSMASPGTLKRAQAAADVGDRVTRSSLRRKVASVRN